MEPNDNKGKYLIRFILWWNFWVLFYKVIVSIFVKYREKNLFHEKYWYKSQIGATLHSSSLYDMQLPALPVMIKHFPTRVLSDFLVREVSKNIGCMYKNDHLICILSIKICKIFTFSFYKIYLSVVRIRLKYRITFNANYILVCNCVTTSGNRYFYTHKHSALYLKEFRQF